jgi:adenylosuccinate lyase
LITHLDRGFFELFGACWTDREFKPTGSKPSIASSTMARSGVGLAICPIDYRYGRKSMKGIFSDEGKLQRMLAVEAALAKAQAQVGMIPPEAAEAISQAVTSGRVTAERVAEIEAEIRHDIMSVVKALAEQAAEAGEYVHLGATSNDIIDTATALQLKEALPIIEDGCRALRDELARLAAEHRSTIQVGRTHGQHAVPITFGLKMAVYALEMDRHLLRLTEARPRIVVGKFLGVVGTGAAMGPHALEVQRLVLESLGLGIPTATLQTLQRDRHAELACILANIAASIEKFATEVRNLQRSEIGEVAEYFDASKQVGSSTMAHKRNPISAENVCGLARIVRSYVVPAFENVPLWHERDLTNSSAERFTLSHQLVLSDYILHRSVGLFRDLEVLPERMRLNLEAAGTEVMAEAVMMALVDRGLGRQQAHELVRRASMTAHDTGGSFESALLSEPELSGRMDAEELQKAMRPEAYLGQAERLVDMALAQMGKG